MSKNYYNDDGDLVAVFQREDNSPWMTGVQKEWGIKIERVLSPHLPFRQHKEQAQKDLDTYAQANHWDEAV